MIIETRPRSGAWDVGDPAGREEAPEPRTRGLRSLADREARRGGSFVRSPLGRKHPHGGAGHVSVRKALAPTF